MRKKNTVLQSKIRTPSTAQYYLVRERLIRRIEDADERLIVVSAGMGYGKTVLLTHYAKRYPERCAWYHLNVMDNDIMAFAGYLRESVASVNPGFQLDLSTYVNMEQSEDMVDSLAMEFVDAFRNLDAEAIDVVLDDFQTIENEWVFRLLCALLDNDSGQLRLILCMKSAPPAFAARYLMEGKALVLGADSLAFNLDEIKILVKNQSAPAALDAVARAVLESTEGWPAGISFVLLYFRQWQQEMTEQEVARACQQSYLRDYFIHEMFRKLPYELQQFLTKTSVLEYLRPDVCNVLAGIDNADSQLAYLEQENLFILHLSGKERIYRYHALFRNFLQEQLKPGERRQLLGKAADFYLRTSDKNQAAEYAIACEDGERLLSAVEAAGFGMLYAGKLETVHRWLDKLECFGIVLSARAKIVQSLYYGRVGEWLLSIELAQQVLDMPEEQVSDISRLSAGLTLAWLKREWVSQSESLDVLEKTVPERRLGRSKMDELRWYGVEMRQDNLLDLGRYNQALSLILDELEDALRRRSQADVLKARELAVVCYAAMGEYRLAMQMYVVLRSVGAVNGMPARCIDLYLAMSGQIQQAYRNVNEAMGQPTDHMAKEYLEKLELLHALIERMAEMEGLRIEKTTVRSNPDIFSGIRSGILYLLWKLFQGQELTQEEEATLLVQRENQQGVLFDAARWILVRQSVAAGNKKRALELCSGFNKTALQKRKENAGTNAFCAFLAVEEILILRADDPEGAAARLGHWAGYLQENRLQCPGLTQQEREVLNQMLAGCGQQMLPRVVEESAEKEKQPEWSAEKATVKCFGPFRVILPDGQTMNWRTRKAQELFAYLFHLNGSIIDREHLLDMLWPQAAPGNATSLLHTTLYSIRKSLAPFGLDGVIQRERRGYRMDMSLVDSVRDQVEAMYQGESTGVEKLPVLYAGAYLEDIEGTWAADSRAWYAGNFLRLCRSAGQRYMNQGEFATAVEFLRRAVSQEPYDEELAGQLIRCYTAMGETKNAMETYKRLKEILAKDLDEEPGEQVTKIYKECLLRRLGRGKS